MKLKSYIISTLFGCVSMCALAQHHTQTKADLLFNNFAFAQAADAYKILIDDGMYSDYATRKLADSYAYMRNPDSAVVYYEKVVRQKHVPAEYFYKYSQALRGVEDYETSRLWMKRFKYAGGDIKEAAYLKDSDFLNSIFSAKTYYTLKDVKFNSAFSDFGAYEHGDHLYFTSSRDKGDIKKHTNAWDKEPFLNIYAIDKNANPSIVTNKSKIKGKVNSIYHDGPLTITKDGKTMFFSRTDFKKNVLGKNDRGISNLKIYKASRIGNKWTNIQELPFNSNQYSIGHPALNEDETKLYFASDKPGGLGGSDIYYVDIKNGAYGKPINLGPIVNTNQNERFPFVNNEGALFFSSDGHPGLGLLDIFGTVSDKNNSIVSVINLGTPVNSSKDDFSFFMNKDGLSGYFASNRHDGAGGDDIYAYNRIPELNLNGIVYDEVNNQPIENALITLTDTNNATKLTANTDENGSYAINIDRDTDYNLTVSKGGFTEFEDTISSKDTDIKVKTLNHDVKILPEVKKENLLGTQEFITLAPIYFNLNSSTIRRQDIKILDGMINAMVNLYPDMIIKIESYSDARGSADFNYKLSQKRANTTYNYLINKGINPSRIMDYKGYGEERLTNNCNSSTRCSEEQHQSNRRTQFIVIKME